MEGFRRRDAQRNHDAVLDAAVALLTERPGASMQEIADASGLGRTTVYRHFPHRDELVTALALRVADEVDRLIEALIVDPAPALEALERFCATLLERGERYRFLEAHRERIEAAGGDRRDAAMRDFLAAAQARGELRDDVGAEWLRLVLSGLMEAAFEHQRGGATDAGELLARTLASTFGYMRKTP